MTTQSAIKFSRVPGQQSMYSVSVRAGTAPSIGTVWRCVEGWCATSLDGTYTSQVYETRGAAADMLVAHVADKARAEVKPAQSWEASVRATPAALSYDEADNAPVPTGYTGDDDGPLFVAVAGQDVGTCKALNWAWASIRPYVLGEDSDAATALEQGVQRAGHDDVHVHQVRS